MASSHAAVTGRTFLFVPGSRPDRFASARAAGADVVVLDLEDAVAPQDKLSARRAVESFLAEHDDRALVVRINQRSSPWHDDDVAMLTGRGAAVMLPKTETAEDVDALCASSKSAPCVVALVETPAGILAAADIARHPAVVRLAFGSLDLAADLGVDPGDRTALSASRSQLVLASGAAGLHPPVDGVTVSPRDENQLQEDIAHAKSLGFGGKLCIHPAQVAASASALRPSEAELDWARRVLDAAGDADGAGSGVITVDGRMVDAPVIKRARRISQSGLASPALSSLGTPS